MKKYLLLIATAMVALQSFGQTIEFDKVKVSNVVIEKQEDLVTVAFRVDVDKDAVRKKSTQTMTPVLWNGENYLVLRSIVVYGKRAQLSTQRNERRWGVENQSVHTRNGAQIDYQYSLPFEPWMEAARVRMEIFTQGCCSETAPTSHLLAQDLRLLPQMISVIDIQAPQPMSTGDRIAKKSSFVHRDLGQDNAGEYIIDPNDADDGSLTILFAQADSHVKQNFKNNNASLVDIFAAVRSIDQSADSEVTKIVIYGFASPEGTQQFNEKLAMARAQSLKTFIGLNTSVGSDKFAVNNGGVNWGGLKELVSKSTIEEKEQIVQIIESDKSHAEKITELRKLKKGETYKYMLHNIFPELRNAAYIKVFYKNK